MRLEFDPLADAAYFSISDAEIERTVQLEPGIVIDYDLNGHVVGVEVLSVSKRAIPAIKEAA